MADEILRERRKALEEAFFAKRDEMLRQKLRDLADARLKKQALSAASGIKDDAALERLGALQIESDTLAALSLVPLVTIAWADGEIDDKERNVALAKAAEMGLREPSVGYQLFKEWLSKRPSPELLTAWKDYIGALSETLDAPAVEALKRELLQRARAVARASGGFLGIGRRSSDAEAAVLDDLESAFPGSTGRAKAGRR